MNRSWQRCFAGAVALMTAAAFASGCNGPPTVPPTVPPETKSQLILTRVGSGAFEANPGDPFTLSALLVLTEKGPVADAQVKWKATQRPGEITFDSAPTSTNGDGVAQLKVTCVDEGEFLFRADSDGAASKAVWKVDCKKPLRYLRIVEARPTVVVVDTPQNTKAEVNAGVSGTIPLTVKAVQTAGAQEVVQSNQKVVFQVYRGVSGTAFSGATDPGYQETTTHGDGLATVQLKVGSTTGTATILATWDNLPPVEFDITISLVHSCNTSAQCKSNEVCVDTVCQPRSTDPSALTCGASDRGCPLGYECVDDNGAKICRPIGPVTCDTCPDGFTCDTNTNECTKTDPDCTTDAQCPNGQCRYGVCYPTNPGSVIDASGHWYTKHDFNVKDALPGWVQFGGSAIRTIDQILLGQLNLPSWVNALIRGVVNQYIPEWVKTLVYLLDNMLTLFSNLRAEGEMDLSQVGGPALLAGNEQWSSFVFYLLSQCGQNIGGDPSMPPPCARVDIYTTELEAADLAVTVKPFTAKVIGPTGGPFNIVFDRRETNLKLAGIIKYVLDQAISITTGYPSLEGPPGQPEQGALYNLVDCPGIAQQIMAAGLPLDVTGLCQAAVIAASQALADQLRNMVVTTDVLSFYGQAAAYDSTGGTTVASDLGYPDFETRATPDGQWTGRVSIVASVKNVPGRWRASREPIPVSP